MKPCNAVAEILWTISNYLPNYRMSYITRPLHSILIITAMRTTSLTCCSSTFKSWWFKTN